MNSNTSMVEKWAIGLSTSWPSSIASTASVADSPRSVIARLRAADSSKRVPIIETISTSFGFMPASAAMALRSWRLSLFSGSTFIIMEHFALEPTDMMVRPPITETR